MNDYAQIAKELAREIIELNPEMTQEELAETYGERIHELADSAVIYYSEAAKIIDDAWGTDINDAECWLDGIYGESIYAGCDTLGAVQCRLAYALVYRGLEDAGEDAIDDAWEWRNTYTFTVNLDERGEYSASVWDFTENTEICNIRSAGDLAQLIIDGAMTDKEDIDGLRDHLAELGLISDEATLIAA